MKKIEVMKQLALNTLSFGSCERQTIGSDRQTAGSTIAVCPEKKILYSHSLTIIEV
ncbi:MAG: hypothetical protein LBF88_02700 [Planctomycetaceae bacterium]|jgi:hypothetical protein|nr:hypothetical protein [Planctomycetaceae bacterium]